MEYEASPVSLRNLLEMDAPRRSSDRPAVTIRTAGMPHTSSRFWGVMNGVSATSATMATGMAANASRACNFSRPCSQRCPITIPATNSMMSDSV